MGVDVPDLDDRTYEEFLADARKRIPAVAEQWTDHNAHDPGITFLELFAWLAEAHDYRFDRIEQRHRRAYLRLLGVAPDPPVRAGGTVRVDPSAALHGVTVPEGTRLLATPSEDGREPLPFRTERTATLSAAAVTAVSRETAGGIDDRTEENRTDGTYFHAFGSGADAGSAMYVGFEGDPFLDPSEPFSLWIDPYEKNLPEPASHGDEAVDFEPSVSLVWEYCRNYEAWHRNAAWEPLEVQSDGTQALYRRGAVTLTHPEPARWQPTDEFGVADAEPGLAWLRVRVERGGYEIPPQIDRLRTNVVPVGHGGAAGPERLVRPDGGEETSARPGQRFEFDRRPVLDATVEVGGDRWTRVESLDGSGPDDHHYVLEPEAGSIRFGDNVRGAVPRAGQAVVATRYEFGGGTGGNLSADASWQFDPAEGGPASRDDVRTARIRTADLEALDPPAGGRAAETVADALARLRTELEVPYRCVTADDYEYVATHTPGLRFGRAKAFTDSARTNDCADLDAVQVVVVPYGTTDRPTPSEGFLDAVDCHLQRHRLVTDRVEAVPPTYVGIGVRTVVRLHDGYTRDGRADSLEAALDAFLSPLSGYDGSGWPFGRPVYRSELSEVVGSVEGVDCVHDLAIDVEGEADRIDAGVRIDPTALVYPTDHALTVSEEPRTCGEVHR